MNMATLNGFALIKAGTFTMGSPPGEKGRNDNEVQHQVTLTHDFYLQTTEVTQGQFQEVMGYNPSMITECGRDCPVERVTWHESAAYCNALSAREGAQLCYRCSGSGLSVACEPVGNPYQCAGYRLPTEAEWEYAARAGTTGPRYGDVSAVAWYAENSGNTLHPVRWKQPNAWGLYDMLGNVWEWNHDWYGDYGGAVTDPWGPAAGSGRVGRGGSWNDDARLVRAAFRSRATTGSRGNDLGFRICRSALADLTKDRIRMTTGEEMLWAVAYHQDRVRGYSREHAVLRAHAAIRDLRAGLENVGDLTPEMLAPWKCPLDPEALAMWREMLTEKES